MKPLIRARSQPIQNRPRRCCQATGGHMKSTMIFGVILAGGLALASGCSSTPPERDYHEYSGIRNQRGMGDALGTSLAGQSSMQAYPKAANPRPSYSPPTYSPHSDVAGLPQD